MNPMLPKAPLALAGALAAVAAATAHGRATAGRPVAAEDQVELPALSPRVLGPLSFGFRAVAADLFFLDAVQLNGARRAADPEDLQERQERSMSRSLALAIELDPKFEEAYRFAGYAGPRQTVEGKAYNVLAVVPLLERGVRECPDDWRIPFLLGFYQLYYLGRMADAGHNMAVAARRPHAPAYLGLLATRLAANANDLETAERMAIGMLEDSNDEESREQWKARILDLDMERGLRAVEAAAERYRARTGKLPRSLEALVAAGDLTAIPREPHGGRYSIDAGGQAHSSASKRLRVQGRPSIASGLEVH